MRSHSLLRLWCYINHLLTYLLIYNQQCKITEAREQKLTKANVCNLLQPRFCSHIGQPAVDCLQTTVQFSYKIYVSLSTNNNLVE